MTATTLRVLLIDDHALFRSGMRLVLEERLPGLQVVEAGSLEESLDLNIEAPTLVLLDIQLQGIDGMTGLGLLKDRWPGVPVIMLSSSTEPETIRLALARGASAFFSKAGKADEIVKLIKQRLPADIAEVTNATRPLLTPRQFEVLALINEGLSNKAIANRLHLSEFTVRGHVQAMLGLLKVSSRSQAIFEARKQGLLP